MRRKPCQAASWVIEKAGLSLPPADEWDIGYEVCFYRDYLWHLGKSAKKSQFSTKRTFDLCLFSERSVVIVEAKVCENFKPKQNRSFLQDAARIKAVLRSPDLEVRTIALASSRYFANASRHGRPATLAGFDGRLSWKQAAERYGDSLFLQAECLYKLHPGELRATGDG